MDKLVSLVIPVYNEEKNIPLIYGEIVKIFSSVHYNYEVIFVNDGSTDNSFLEIMKISEENEKVRGIDFSRNFGKEAATSAGCHVAAGDAVITMDADLQHPTELIPTLIKKWEAGAEVVYTVRMKSEGATLMKRLTSAVYYWLFNKVSEVRTEPRSTDFRLMDKKVIDVFRNFPERARMFRGMIDWMGYRRVKVEFQAQGRRHGKAVYSYRKLFRLAMNSFTSFSLLPLKIAGYLGVIITVLSGLLLFFMLITLYVFDLRLFSSLAVLATSNTFLIGIVLISLGFIATYIARIHDEVINRPLYIVREKININEGEK